MKKSVILICVILLIAGVANAQWLYTDLHPAWSTSSHLLGVSAGDQVGQAQDASGKWHGMRWQFSASSAIDFGIDTKAWATNGTYQLGTKGPAARWQGTTASAVLLPSPPNTTTLATTIYSQRYAGYTFLRSRLGTKIRAIYWPALTSNPVILPLPPNFDQSAIYAMYQDTKVGSVSSEIDGLTIPNAATWEGDTHTFINRHPAGYYMSMIRGVAGRFAAGWASENEYLQSGHAAIWDLWSGGFYDFHPWEYYSSNFFAISDRTAVGQAIDWSGYTHAIAMDINSGVVTDLHQFLPSHFSVSTAYAVYAGPGCGGYQVGGWAYSTLDNKEHAILWYTPFC